MRKVFFVYGIRFLSKRTLKRNLVISPCTYEHLSDAETFMSNMCASIRKSGHVIIMAQVFKKVIEL